MRTVTVLWLSALLLGGCNTPRAAQPVLDLLGPTPDAEAVGVFHQVRPGETLYGICGKYGAKVQEVAEVNGIEDPAHIRVGQQIFLPDVTQSTSPTKQPAAGPVRRYEGRFIWPVDGVLTSRFGLRRGRRHDGIDIGAPEGAPIRAAADGTVLFVGKQGGYGNLVILQHKDNWITVYAHNSKNLVAENDRVKQRQQIAKVGQTGRSTGPHVHFEIRQGTKPRNPLYFLPKPSS